MQYGIWIETSPVVTGSSVSGSLHLTIAGGGVGAGGSGGSGSTSLTSPFSITVVGGLLSTSFFTRRRRFGLSTVDGNSTDGRLLDDSIVSFVSSVLINFSVLEMVFCRERIRCGFRVLVVPAVSMVVVVVLDLAQTAVSCLS